MKHGFACFFPLAISFQHYTDWGMVSFVFQRHTGSRLHKFSYLNTLLTVCQVWPTLEQCWICLGYQIFTGRPWRTVQFDCIIQVAALLGGTFFQFARYFSVLVSTSYIIVSLLEYARVHLLYIKNWLLMGGKFSIRRIYYISILMIMQQQKFPQDIQCIVQPIQGLGGIFVSNIQVAQNPKTLEKHGIGAVISAVKGKNLQKIIPIHIEYLYIPAVDHQSFDISYYFQDSNNFIEEERRRTNVLVHCMAGISRSVTLIIAYLMKVQNKTFEQVYKFFKVKRKIIHPNNAFLAQLKEYEKTLIKPLVQRKTQNEVILQQNKDQGRFKKTSQVKIDNQTKNMNKSKQNYDLNLKASIKNIFKLQAFASRNLPR